MLGSASKWSCDQIGIALPSFWRYLGAAGRAGEAARAGQSERQAGAQQQTRARRTTA